jgi:hypothetical protein
MALANTVPARKLTTRQVIDRIMEVVEYLPDAVKDLPDYLRSRKHWEKTLSPRNPRAIPVLKVLSELPAFTNHAPKKSSPQTWRKVFIRHMGLEQIPGTLREIHAIANMKSAKRKPIVYWRDAFGRDEVVQRVRPKTHSDYIHNPHRGTTTFQRFQGEDTYPSFITADTYGPVDFPNGSAIPENVKYIPRTTLTYCRWPWKWLEPEKGKFNWKLIDGTLKAAHNRGQTAQLRFQPYTMRVNTDVEPLKAKRHPPGWTVNLPDWYWDTGAKWIDRGPYAKHEPDSNDPLYLKHFGDFIRAFAKRYDGHPDLESVDMAYAGFWGESGGNSTARTAYKLTDIYLKSFKKTQLLSMLGTPGCHHAASTKNGHTIGWRADCFGDLRKPDVPEVPRDLCYNHTFDGYPKEIEVVRDAWKTAPVTMETCGNVATWVMGDYDLDYIIAEGYKYHMSVFMPKNAFFPEHALAKLIEFDKKIGYRFELKQMRLPLQAKPGSKIHVDVFIDNVGCAPIYRPYKLALRFKQGKKSRVVRFREDIRRWLPGHSFFEEKIEFPRGFTRGEVKVALGVVDETNTPRVWFAIQGQTDDGWHPLTSMDAIS